MLKLTVFCPADQTDAVVDVLRAEPAVRNVLLLPGAGALNGRDVVMAYLSDGALDAVLAHLRALRTWEAGDLSVINVDLVVRHDVAQMDATGEPGDERGAIGRELMLVQADEEARLSWPYLVFMICAGLIAAIGLVHDLPILIVGAMSLSPDLAPANAIAVTLTMGAFRRMAKALWTLLAGLTLALLVAFVVPQPWRPWGRWTAGWRRSTNC